MPLVCTEMGIDFRPSRPARHMATQGQTGVPRRRGSLWMDDRCSPFRAPAAREAPGTRRGLARRRRPGEEADSQLHRNHQLSAKRVIHLSQVPRTSVAGPPAGRGRGGCPTTPRGPSCAASRGADRDPSLTTLPILWGHASRTLRDLSQTDNPFHQKRDAGA